MVSRKKDNYEKAAREKLSHQHLITTVDELKGALQDIESEDVAASKKRQKKMTLTRVQINIRKY